MNLEDIQPNLLEVLELLPILSDNLSSVLTGPGISDEENTAMNNLLMESGLAILIAPPDCEQIISQGQGVASMQYVCCIWIRTNPKVQVDNAPKWNPRQLERLIIPAVLAFGMAPSVFKVSEDIKPMTDYTDIGNDSRMIHFSTPVIMQ